MRAGRGRLLVNDVSGAFARSTLAGVPAAAHTDLLLSDGWTSASAQSYFNVFVRGSGGWQNGNRPRTGYGLNFTSNASRVTVPKRTPTAS